jgi:Peptidase M50B-like
VSIAPGRPGASAARYPAGPAGPAAPPAVSPGQIVGLIALAALVAVLLAWIDWLRPLAYPFRLLLTLVHELSHGLAALATGGRFLRFVVFADGSGLAYTAGGWRLVVIPAGYLGAAAFGAALILTGRSRRGGRAALGLVGAAVVLLTLRYGLPTVFTAQVGAGLLTVAGGLGIGALLVWIAVAAGPRWTVFTLYLLAIEAGLASFTDLWTLIGLATTSAVATDARSMAELTHLPALVWAVLWALAAAAILGAAVRVALRAGPAGEAAGGGAG